MSDATKNRNLVTEALEPLLPKGDVARAVTAWAAAFENKPTLVPSIVAGHIAKALDIADKEEAIRTRLTQLMLREHGTNPGAAARAASARQPAAPPGRSHSGDSGDGRVVFRALLAGIVERLRDLLGADAAGMESEWGRLFKRKPLSSAARQTIERWCEASGKGVNAPIGTDIPTEDMKTVVHGIYVWCCEALGPVEADRLFADSVEAAAGLPEARSFAPTQLL